MKILKCKITFLEELLGTSPANTEVYRDFIGSKAPDAAKLEDEVAALGAAAVADLGRTVFPKTPDGRPFLYDYQIKGFFKDACSMLARCAGKDPDTGKKIPVNESSKLTAFKKVIDGTIFVEPRKIPLQFDGQTGELQRPLRAQTAQGERVSLVCSETCPEGTTIEVTITCLNDKDEAAVREWLDYGRLRGIGQWRNSGKGRFTWEEITG